MAAGDEIPNTIGNPTVQFGYWQLCPKCNGEGYIPGTHYNGETLSVDRTCPVCAGDKILARPVVNNDKEAIQ